MGQHDYTECLGYIDPDCGFGDWLSVGMALHREGFGLETWDDWSSRGKKYNGISDLEKHWKTFTDKPGGVTGGTLVELAMRHGYRGNAPGRGIVGGGGGPDSDRHAGSEPQPTRAAKSTAGNRESRSPIVQHPATQGASLRIIDRVPAQTLEITNSEATQEEKLAAFLIAMFERDEFVSVVTKAVNNAGKWQPADRGSASRTRGELVRALKADGATIEGVFGPYNHEAGAWIRVNPVVKCGSKDEDVTAYRHGLFEFDDMPIQRQLELAATIRLPYTAVVYSGSKSIHFAVPLCAKNRAEYDERWNQVYRILRANMEPCEVGRGKNNPDPSCKNPSRLMRAPGFARGEEVQKLLALCVDELGV